VLHPSLLPPVGVEPLDPLLVADIAAGLAQTIPAGTRPGQVLATDRYDAWLLEVPAGHTWHVLPDHRVGAAHVIDGALIERWSHNPDAAPIARTANTGETISVGLGTREVANEASGAARIIVVSSPPALRAPTPVPRAHPLRLVS
jgi:hypothetical protein